MYAASLVLALAAMASAQSFSNTTMSSTTMRSTTTSMSSASTSASSSVTSSSSASASASVCSGGVTQSLGAGPLPTPDTPSAFLALPALAAAATGAVTPAGYSLAFANAQGAVSNAQYLGYYTLPSYSPALCAARCDSTTGCTSFNTYFERDPIVIPGTGSGCTNPASTDNIKCALFGTNVTLATATNRGQYRASFQVVIAGSNGYNRVPHALACPAGTTPGVCGTYVLNNFYDICACGSDVTGAAVEVQAIYCDGTLTSCASNNDCPADYVCQVNSCCSNTPVCAPSVTCGNNLNASRMFRRGGAIGKNSSLFKEGAPGFSS